VATVTGGSPTPDGCFALRKMVLAAYEWVRFLALLFKCSTSIAGVHIIHGFQGPSTHWSPQMSGKNTSTSRI
jgi:hypothetical protein